MYRWEKIPCVLHWTVHSIHLKQKSRSEFQFFWSRGSEKGQTDRVRGDDDGVVNFESTFETKCTVYLSKSDKHPKQKKLKLQLKRYVDAEITKIYGRLTLDISRYFDAPEYVRESIEMESGRSTAPIMIASFRLQQIGESTVTEIDANERSYFDEDNSRQALGDWDQTEIGKPVEYDRSRMDGETVVKKMPVHTIEVGEEWTRSEDPGFVPDISLDLEEPVEEKTVKEEPVPEPKIVIPPKPKRINICQLIKAVLSVSWTSMQKKDVFLDASNKYKFPGAVFPILSVLGHTRMFMPEHVTDEEFEEALNVIINGFRQAPLEKGSDINSKLLTNLVIAYEVSTWSTAEGKSSERISRFLDAMEQLFSEMCGDVLNPLIMNFQVLCNRYATAKFDVDPLLDDFRQVMSSVHGSLIFPPSVHKFMMDHFTVRLDAILLNKIIANPSRLMFSNAIVWNSFITAFEVVEKMKFNLLRESVCALVMAPNLTNPATCEDIRSTVCPDIEPELLAFLMKHYHTDEMMPNPIDYVTFMKNIGVNEIAGYGPIKPQYVNGYLEAASKLKVSQWRNVDIPDLILHNYPYFKQYMQK